MQVEKYISSHRLQKRTSRAGKTGANDDRMQDVEESGKKRGESLLALHHGRL